MPDRDECYARIKQSMLQDITEYYDKFPERRLDDRSVAAIAASYVGIERILAILDDYTIVKMQEAK